MRLKTEQLKIVVGKGKEAVTILARKPNGKVYIRLEEAKQSGIAGYVSFLKASFIKIENLYLDDKLVTVDDLELLPIENLVELTSHYLLSLIHI